MGAVLALSKGQKGAWMVVQEEVEGLKVVFSSMPLHLASSAASYPCFLLLFDVALIHGSCLDDVVVLGGHLWGPHALQ